MSFEVATPIQNSPYGEPSKYWFIREGEEPKLLDGRQTFGLRCDRREPA